MRYADPFVSPWLINNLGAPVRLSSDTEGRIWGQREDGSDRWSFREEAGDETLVARLRSGESVRGIVRLEDQRRVLRFADDVRLERERAERAERERRSMAEHLAQEARRHVLGGERRAMNALRRQAVADLAQSAGFRHALASKIVLSGLTRNSSGSGDNASTVAHILAEEDLVRGRLRRSAGAPLCGPSRGSFDLSEDSGSYPLCKTCCATLERLSGRSVEATARALFERDKGALDARRQGRAAFVLAVQPNGAYPRFTVFLADSEEQAKAVEAALTPDDQTAFSSGPVPLDRHQVETVCREIVDAVDLVQDDGVPPRIRLM